jgi:hypothetical protein
VKINIAGPPFPPHNQGFPPNEFGPPPPNFNQPMNYNDPNAPPYHPNNPNAGYPPPQMRNDGYFPNQPPPQQHGPNSSGFQPQHQPPMFHGNLNHSMGPQGFNAPPPDHGFPPQPGPYQNTQDWGGGQQRPMPQQQQRPDYFQPGMPYPGMSQPGVPYPSEMPPADYSHGNQQQPPPPPPPPARIEPKSQVFNVWRLVYVSPGYRFLTLLDQVRVLYDYVATEKNAISSRAGELATLLEVILSEVSIASPAYPCSMRFLRSRTTSMAGAP